MLELKGYCPNCPCWFAVPDRRLEANRLCPCCLQPAARISRIHVPVPILRNRGVVRVLRLTRVFNLHR